MVKITLEDNSINYYAGGATSALSLKLDLLSDSLLLNDLLLELG